MNKKTRVAIEDSPWGWWKTRSKLIWAAQNETHPAECWITLDSFFFSPVGILTNCGCYGKCNHYYALKILLRDRGADPNATCWFLAEHERNDPLCLAAKRGNIHMFRLLLEYGADPGTDEDTPFKHPSCNDLVTACRLRRAACFSVAWCFAQIQQPALMEPVVQRVASVPLYKALTRKSILNYWKK